jgi:patatin-related protein
MEPRGVELRLALAMRGGVSLAVWIGGACAEIDQCRRADDDAQPGSAFWRPLLERGGYERVIVDVLAGASAGGLNGVLYAASQVYDFPYSGMRDIWLKIGSVESLVRRDDPWPSLFKGDDYFQQQLWDRLCELASAPRDSVPEAPVVDLSLSATYIEPVERPVPSPSDEQLTDRRFASGFRFRQPGRTTRWTGTDFPPPASHADFTRAMRRLAVAGRSTSSFPGAFEAAAMTATRPPAFGQGADDPLANVVEMGGALLDSGTPGLQPDQGEHETNKAFVVADGGILDNIPIGRALDALAAAPAESRTERLLIYLQPGASSPPKQAAAVPLDTRRNSISVIRGAAQTKIGGETINADIAELEDHNDAVARAIAIRLGTYKTLADPATLLDAAGRRWDNYRLTRAQEDAHRLFTLLCDPVGTLGTDPFPAALIDTAISDAVWRSPIAAWPSERRELLQAELANEMQRDERGIDSAFTVGVKPLVRVTQLLIEWARFRENNLDEDLRDVASETKRKLYGVVEFVKEAIDKPRGLLWVAAAAHRQQPNDASGFATLVPGIADRLCLLRTEDVSLIEKSLLAGTSEGLAEARQWTFGRIAHLACGGSDPSGLVDARERLVTNVLSQIVIDLAQHPVDVEVLDNCIGKGEPAALLERVLGSSNDIAQTGQVLAALEVLSFPEFASGLPGRRPIRFVRMSSANRAPVAPAFHRVLEEAARQRLWWGDSTDPATQQGIHVNLKLAGNELANFSAFLVAEWRANDWLWGRLDAVPTLVDHLVKPTWVKELVPETRDGDWSTFDREILPDDVSWKAVYAEAAETRRDLVHTEAFQLRELEGMGLSAAPIPLVRNALIARRQSQILAEELALPWSPMEATRELSPEQVWQDVATRRFGSETMKDNDHATELADRFDELTSALASTVVWNVNQSAPAGIQLGDRRAKLTRWAVTNAGRLGVRKLLRSGTKKAPSAKRKVAISVGLALAIGLGIIGFLMNRWAFIIGAALGLAVVVPIGLWIKHWLVKLFREPVPPKQQQQE